MSISFVEQTASAQLIEQIKFFSERLALLRGDNLYDVSRMFFSGIGVNCVQERLEVNIPGNVKPEDSDAYILDVFEKQILAPAGLRFLRVIMGRLICTDTDIVGALVNVRNENTKGYYDLLGGTKLVNYGATQFREIIRSDKVPFLTRLAVNSQGGLTTNMVPVGPRRNVPDISKMYPYFGEERMPAAAWEAFKKSDSNVMLLIGPPGTGKSNWLTELLIAADYADDNAHIADREDVLLNPGLPDYIRSLRDGGIFITEDSDKLVESRDLDNSNMSSMLNAANGIVASKSKILISTNLTSLSRVDKALTRGGRCFDILEFKELTRDQAIEVREMMGCEEKVEFPTVSREYTLADALNWHEKLEGRKQRQSVGFTGN